MFRITLLAIAACTAWAQPENPFNRPPAEVDKALRERITLFFQYHVTGEYRKAEALVAEDTKDYFYNHNKPKYLGFEINRIEYLDNFTKAKAVVTCEQRINAPGFGNQIFKVPTPSSWKLENGQWFWWVEPDKVNLTPFGRMTPGPEPARGGSPAPSAANIPATPDFLFDQVKFSKTSLTIPPQRQDTVEVQNTAPGEMTVRIIQAPPGVEAKLGKNKLEANEKTTLTVTCSKEAQSGDLRLTIDPIGQTVVIQITAK